MMSCACLASATTEQLMMMEYVSSTETDVRLRISANSNIHVRPNATADTFVVLPFPERLSGGIVVSMRDMVEATNRRTAYANAFWSKDTTGENSLIVFASEYKRGDNTRNKNQLGINFGAAQSQRRALGLGPAIVWGATCARGCFEVFSSE